MEISEYDPGRESEQVFAIWKRNFHDRWPISLRIFREVTEATHSHAETYQLVAKDHHHRVVGYIGSQIRPRCRTEASLILLAVDPGQQRRGIGTRLLNATLQRLKEEDISLVHVGARAALPFWHGIPVCLPEAKAFFSKQKWEIYEKSYDLIMDLRDFSVPQWVMKRADEQGIEIRGGRSENVPAILDFHAREFPDWRRWFVEEIESRGPGNIVIALKGSEVLGSLLIGDTGNLRWSGRQWRAFLGDDMGMLGAVGVKRSARNKGIGLALVAEGSRILKERAIRNCFVHWTWLVDWYGRLGYHIWQEYWMVQKRIG